MVRRQSLVVIFLLALIAVIAQQRGPLPQTAVQQAPPNPWLGAAAPQQSAGLSACGVNLGEPIEEVRRRVRVSTRWSRHGEQRRVVSPGGTFRLGGKQRGEGRDTVEWITSADLRTVWLDGKPLFNEITVRDPGPMLKSRLQADPEQNDGYSFIDSQGRHLSVVLADDPAKSTYFMW